MEKKKKIFIESLIMQTYSYLGTEETVINRRESDPIIRGKKSNYVQCQEHSREGSIKSFFLIILSNERNEVVLLVFCR